MTKTKTTPLALAEDLKQRALGLRKRADSEWTRLEKQARDLRRRAEKSEVAQNAKKLRKDLDKQIGGLHAQMLDVLGLASKSELERVQRKVNELSRKFGEAA